MAALTTVATLSACSLGQARTFDRRAEDACAKAATAVAGLPRRTTGTAALAYALDRYTTIERLLAEVSADPSFPSGARGRRLNATWIDPARASLTSGRTAMAQLRQAVNASDAAATSSAFTTAAGAGTAGVDVAALVAAGLPRCAAAFTATPSTSAASGS